MEKHYNDTGIGHREDPNWPPQPELHAAQQAPTEDPVVLRSTNFAWIAVRRKDFWSSPVFLRAFLSKEKAQEWLYAEAKRIWRYTGERRESYIYFDQELRLTQVILED